MTVERICVCDVDTAEPGESAQTAARRMNDRKVGTLVVVDEFSRPVGMLTDRDLAIRVVATGADPFTTTVEEIMTRPVRSVTSTTPIEEALGLMRSAGCRRLSVVDKSGKLLGLLSLDDILELLAEEFRDIGKLLRKERPESLGSTTAVA